MCSKEIEFKCILFALCYFHAVVAERRKFGAQGWNRSYPFNNGDLTISINVLYNYLEANPKVRSLQSNHTSGEGAKPWFAAQTPPLVGTVQQGCGTHALSTGWEQSTHWLGPLAWLLCWFFLNTPSYPDHKACPKNGGARSRLGLPTLSGALPSHALQPRAADPSKARGQGAGAPGTGAICGRAQDTSTATVPCPVPLCFCRT